jgi:hypothetical protein
VPLNSSGAATFTTSSLVGLQTYVNAFYLGDANNAPATGTMVQTVTDIVTVTTVTSSANNVLYGTPVVFTATVLDNTGKPAKGFVYFLLGNLSYAEAGLDSNGQATWTNGTGGPSLPAGTDTVTVDFFPYNGYEKSSGTIAETFTALGTTPNPTLRPPAGTYTSAQQVVLGDSNVSAETYYTTNGSAPVPGVSPGLPAGFSLPVSASETITVIALAPGYSPSAMVTATYIINIVPDFNLSMSPASMTLPAGGTGATAVLINGFNGFNGVVSLSCSGLPAGATCAFAPGNSSGTGNPTLTIKAPTTLGMNVRPVDSRFLSLAVMAMAFGCFRMRRRTVRLLVLAGYAPLLWALNGCGGASGAGGGSGSPPPPTSTTYCVTVTGTSGSLSHSAPLSLTITN